MTQISSPAAATPAIAGAIPRRQLAAAAVGNLIEYFDWSAYVFLAVYFAKQFFPADTDPIAALIGTFGIMAIGFLVRPISGLVIGKIADRLGRRFALMLTVYGMGGAALVIGLTPTYAQIGILAPIVLILARIVQGICIGGEFGAVTAFSMEVAPEGRRGFISGVIYAVACAGQILVILLVALATWTLSPADMTSWGWRAIFIFGALLSLAGVWIRRGMAETIDTEPAKREPVRIFDAVRQHPKATLKVVGLTIGFTAMTYAWGNYMPTYAATYKGLDPKFGLISLAIAVSIVGIASIGIGRLTDRFGRKPILLTAGALLAVGTVPALGLLNDQLVTLVILQTIAMSALALIAITVAPTFAEMFPKKFRAAGLGFPYAATVGLVGGTTPLIGTQFVAWGAPLAFPWYLTGLMVISVIFYATMKETAFKPIPS